MVSGFREFLEPLEDLRGLPFGAAARSFDIGCLASLKGVVAQIIPPAISQYVSRQIGFGFPQ